MDRSEISGKLLLAGPCSAESREQVMATAREIASRYPQAIFRAGVWKPRTRPGAFEGRGEEALAWLREVRAETGMKVMTEAANAKQAEACLEAGLDAVWIGARTTVNPFLVQEVADALRGTSIVVMVKNPIHPDVELWRGAIERVKAAVKAEVLAIHRGFHSFETTEFRNHPRWQLAFELRSLMPDLRMICDISHIAGARPLLQSVAQEALDLNYDGWMIETHIQPDLALTDKQQQVTPERLEELLSKLHPRHAKATDPLSLAQLESWRREIDRLDEEILKLLKERLHFSEQIGELKKEKQVSIFQPERWKAILDEMM
ncbi:MAG: bifunctional 3-deoxy-7-phosphoheptulonate synthase/chorismate mutase type II, partial [Bacteroidia bacterium]|nr:bifunctional 3-deoxy-7-phosphoheptulonate synthase/chorismate mutase type II [Bacteroidia bacterium]